MITQRLSKIINFEEKNSAKVRIWMIEREKYKKYKTKIAQEFKVKDENSNGNEKDIERERKEKKKYKTKIA